MLSPALLVWMIRTFLSDAVETAVLKRTAAAAARHRR
jgi:hypothetical protein